MAAAIIPRFYKDREYIGVKDDYPYGKMFGDYKTKSISLKHFKGRPYNVYEYKEYYDYTPEKWQSLLKQLEADAGRYKMRVIAEQDYAYLAPIWEHKPKVTPVTPPKVSTEPVKGEQAGMLGVPGKYVEQKRPWTPGQIEIESYVKYKKAMEKPERVAPVAPEVTVPEITRLESEKAVQSLVNELRQVRQQHIDKVISRTEFLTKQKDIAKRAIEVEPLDIAKETWRNILTRTESELAIPKAEAKVEAEAMKQAEKPSKNLYWYSIAELKRMCQNKGLSAEGSKQSLIRRLK